MLKSLTPLSFTRLLSENSATPHKLLVNCMQKTGAYSATVFISTLPFISRLMHNSGNHIQMTLTVFFVGSLVGELLAGPLHKMIGCKHIFILGVAFYLLSAMVIRYSSVPSLLMAARVVQALGAMASVAVTLYSFYTASPILPMKAVANPAGGFRHLFLILAAGILIGGLSTRLGHIAFLLSSLPTAFASILRPLLWRLISTISATTFGAAWLAKSVRLRDEQPLFSGHTAKVAHIYARHEYQTKFK